MCQLWMFWDLAMKRLRGLSTICKSRWGWIVSMTNWAPLLCVSKWVRRWTALAKLCRVWRYGSLNWTKTLRPIHVGCVIVDFWMRRICMNMWRRNMLRHMRTIHNGLSSNIARKYLDWWWLVVHRRDDLDYTWGRFFGVCMNGHLGYITFLCRNLKVI